MLLLGVCCAPCSLPILESDREVSLFFYGPNIWPREEYDRRLEAARQVAQIYGVALSAGEHDHGSWLEYIRSNISSPPEQYPENSERCRACFAYRIDRTAEYAQEHGFHDFALTLSVSRFKDVSFINGHGETAGSRRGLNYRPIRMDADQAHQIGLRLSKQHGIYRQKYCGCEFSLRKGA